MPKPTSLTPFVPPSRNEWNLLFQPLFDELLTPPPSVDLLVPKVIAPIDEVVAPELAESTGSPSLTTVDQDAASPNALTQSCWIEAMQEELNEFEQLEDKEGKGVDPLHYCGMIGTLLYLTASRPDLQFAICMCTGYQARPTEKHLHVVKRIFQYLRRTVNRGLWYLKDSSIELTAFADADHAG
nr:uncharacterized mitochondrial protein AtMg00810-like [Tanacetum cinerariifolium]